MVLIVYLEIYNILLFSLIIKDYFFALAYSLFNILPSKIYIKPNISS